MLIFWASLSLSRFQKKKTSSFSKIIDFPLVQTILKTVIFFYNEKSRIRIKLARVEHIKENEKKNAT